MLQKRIYSLLVAALFCVFALTASAQQNNSQSQQNNSQQQNQLSQHDQHFLKQMAKDGEGEVQIAQMVESKTSNPQVKEYAKRMISDHRNLDRQIAQLMAKKGVTKPQPMTAEQKQLKTKLQGLSGSALDKAFMQAQVKDHQEDVREVSKVAQRDKQLQPSDPAVAQLAQEALPVLKGHLNMAKQVAGEVGAPMTAQTIPQQ